MISAAAWQWLMTLLLVTAGSSYEYEPSENVRRMHALPHLDASLKRQSNDFDTSEEYGKSLIPFPAILIAIAVILIVTFLLVLCSRCCCACAKCGPALDLNTKASVVFQKRKWKFVFLVLCALIVIAAFTMLDGNKHLTRGAERAIDVMEDLEDTFLGFVADGEVLQQEGEDMEVIIDEASNSSCPQADDALDPYMDDYFTAVQEFIDFAEPMASDLNDAAELTYRFGIKRKNEIIWEGFGCVLGMVGLYLIGLLCSSTLVLQLAIGLSLVIVLGVTVMNSFILVVLMGLADICMDPDRAVMQQVSGSIEDVAAYYIECLGENPLDEAIASVTNTTQEMEEAVQQMTESGGQCESDAILDGMYDIFDAVYNATDNLLTELDCEPIQYHWRQFAHKAVCDESYDGMYGIWLSLFVAALLLFLLAITASIVYQYYLPEVVSFLESEEQGDIELPMTPQQVEENSRDGIIRRKIGMSSDEEERGASPIVYDRVLQDDKRASML